MPKTMLVLALGLVLACGVAFAAEGRVANAVLAGGLLAGAVGWIGLAVQLRLAHTRPNLATAGLALSFGLKLLALIGGVLAIRFVPGLPERFDALAFLLAFAAMALVLLLAGTWELAGLLRRQDSGEFAVHTPSTGA